MIDDPESELPPFNFHDDIVSVYESENMGDNEDSLNDLFIGLGEHQAGPSRLGRGKGKDISVYNQVYRKNLVADEDDPIVEEEGEADSDKELEDVVEGDDTNADVSEGVISISPLHYAMEFPSPSQEPYIQSIYEHEIDLDF